MGWPCAPQAVQVPAAVFVRPALHHVGTPGQASCPCRPQPTPGITLQPVLVSIQPGLHASSTGRHEQTRLPPGPVLAQVYSWSGGQATSSLLPETSDPGAAAGPGPSAVHARRDSKT